jgi:PHP-associated
MTPNGWVRVDCHLHTVASGDANLTLEQLAVRAKENGLDVVCVTDHNETSAAVAAAERDLGVRIVTGEEIRTPDGDLIGLFLAERIPYVLPLAEVVGRIRAQGGLVYVPHPFDRIRASLGAALPGMCERGDVDVVEVFNAKIDDQALNDQAAALAAAYGLPGGAGSDAHDADGVGAAWLEMPDFDGPASFLAALPQARITGEYRPHALRYPRRVLPSLAGAALRSYCKAPVMYDAPGALNVRLGEKGRLALVPSANLLVGGAAIFHCSGVVNHNPVNCRKKFQSVSALKPLDFA